MGRCAVELRTVGGASQVVSRSTCRQSPIGFFQIGGGIAGDFSICVVPMLIQDLEEDVPLWAYFAQISECSNELRRVLRRGAQRKDHLDQAQQRMSQVHDPRATPPVVAPLIFAYVLGL